MSKVHESDQIKDEMRNMSEMYASLTIFMAQTKSQIRLSFSTIAQICSRLARQTVFERKI